MADCNTEVPVAYRGPRHVALQSGCATQTSEAERIGVNQVAKILPSGKASGSDQRALSCLFIFPNFRLGCRRINGRAALRLP